MARAWFFLVLLNSSSFSATRLSISCFTWPSCCCSRCPCCSCSPRPLPCCPCCPRPLPCCPRCSRPLPHCCSPHHHWLDPPLKRM